MADSASMTNSMPADATTAALDTAGRVMDVIDRASIADNQWLFVASQVLLLGFAALVIWFLVKRSERAETENKIERKEIRDEMEKERARFSSIIEGYRDELGKLAQGIAELNRSITAYDRDMRFSLMQKQAREGMLPDPHIGT